MAKKYIKRTFLVNCIKNPAHEFEIVVEVEQGTEGKITTREEYCPYCGEMVQVEIQGLQKPDEAVLRGLGFSD